MDVEVSQAACLCDGTLLYALDSDSLQICRF
ncbi:hypothetical protein TRL7639_04306 [Falsiruegeria litorea R37]|uniref:Uncharacterized protein n=1 Tax=Falsiruegeria litorea R37 TaxID=1200284 RepID=A0A1Y5TTK3_9RHOB|nr:hypothetical protein TRL7639_04306 [Falsiruegeria litorea R37]